MLPREERAEPGDYHGKETSPCTPALATAPVQVRLGLAGVERGWPCAGSRWRGGGRAGQGVRRPVSWLGPLGRPPRSWVTQASSSIPANERPSLSPGDLKEEPLSTCGDRTGSSAASCRRRGQSVPLRVRGQLGMEDAFLPPRRRVCESEWSNMISGARCLKEPSRGDALALYCCFVIR